MIRPRRLRAWTCLAALALLALETHPALGQGKFPARPIRIVSPFAAGSVSDLSLRLFADKLATRVNGQVIMDNQPRAGGVTAATTVLSAPPDGYTIALFSTSTAISVSLFKQLPYDPGDEFAPAPRSHLPNLAPHSIRHLPLIPPPPQSPPPPPPHFQHPAPPPPPARADNS